MTVGQLKNIISVIPDDVEIEESDTWRFMDLPRVSARGAKTEGAESMSETVNKVIAEMEYKFEIGAIIALLRKLQMATWNYNIARREHIGVLVEDVLKFLIDAMEKRLEKEKQEDEK